MDLNLLRTFAAVADARSFTAAAQALGYTQSAVSQQVAALESDLGVVLLRRRPVVPTDAGTRLLEHAGPLLLRVSAARADVRRAAASPPEHLRVGSCPLAVPRLVAALSRVAPAMPKLDVTLRVADRHTVVTEVAVGRLDTVLVVGVAAPGDPLRLPDAGPLRAVRVGGEPLAVVVPADHPLAGQSAVGLADLADARWIDAPGITPAPTTLRAMTGLPGFGCVARYAGSDVAGLVTLAAAGWGLALLPARVVAGRSDAVAVPVVAPALEFRTEVVSGAVALPSRSLRRLTSALTS